VGFTTFNDMLRRMAWRLPEHAFLTWTDRNRSITYAQGVEQSEWVAGALASLVWARATAWVSLRTMAGLCLGDAVRGDWRDLDAHQRVAGA